MTKKMPSHRRKQIYLQGLHRQLALKSGHQGMKYNVLRAAPKNFVYMQSGESGRYAGIRKEPI